MRFEKITFAALCFAVFATANAEVDSIAAASNAATVVSTLETLDSVSSSAGASAVSSIPDSSVAKSVPDTSAISNMQTSTDVSAASDSANKTVQKTLPFYVPLIEGQAQNILVWAWDRYYIGANYAKINLHTMKQNFKDGFTWDDNHYAINFVGHPFQGSFYYNAARGSGYGFYSSFGYAAFGSLTWELLMEREQPSINDLLTTSLDGAFLGEVMFRMSSYFYEHPNSNLARKIAAFMVDPIAFLHNTTINKGGASAGYTPIEFSIFSGFGSHIVNEYSYAEGVDVLENTKVWNGKAGIWGADLQYGKRGRTVKKPFDYFKAHYHQILSGEKSSPNARRTLFSVDMDAILKNRVFGSEKDWTEFALKMQYDVLYGDFAEMGATALGLGITFEQNLSERWRIAAENRLSWVIIGASDFNYEDALPKLYPTLDGYRAYQIGYGVKYNLNFDLEWKNRGKFFSNNKVYFLSTFPGSTPHYGIEGVDFVAEHFGGFEIYLPKGFSIGYAADIYWKIAAYEEFAPMSRLIGSNWGYVKYAF